MISIRRSLRFWVTTWLVFQVASLSALVPRDCCAAHKSEASVTKPSCHQEVAPATQCPMRAANGTACPMHRGDHHEAADTSRSDCAMRGTCRGPMVAMVAQLSNHGVLPSQFSVLPDLHQTAALISVDEHPVTRLTPPDSPPPRA